MIFTEEVLRQLIAWAQWRTQRSLGIIKEEDPALPADVLEQIASRTGHYAALQAFVEAYSDWFAFHLRIFQAGKQGNLSAAESAELVMLSNRRDEARADLVEITEPRST